MALQRVRPEEIEKRSMEIIRGELEGLGPLPPADRLPVVERVIHATADFEYGYTLVYSKGAVGILEELVRNGIYQDCLQAICWSHFFK